MLLHDVQSKNYSEIAIQYKISPQFVRALYIRISLKKLLYYIKHLSKAYGYQDQKLFRRLYESLFECYANNRYVIAFFEKNFRKTLDEYRAGEPGMAREFILNLPPYVKKWNKNTILSIVEMREDQKKTYEQIGKQLNITKEKAQQLYEHYYHAKIIDYLNKLGQDKYEFTHPYLDLRCSSKKCLEKLLQDHPELLDHDK